MQRKTKIVATIGPASDSREMLADMISAGMNVARLNLSHGSHDEHQARLDQIDQASGDGCLWRKLEGNTAVE